MAMIMEQSLLDYRRIETAIGFIQAHQREQPSLEQVIIVHKTHFDIGYTDLAVNVVRRYRTERALLASDPGEAAFALLEANHLRVSHRGPGAPPPASGSPSGQEISYRSLLREVPDRDGLADTARRLGPPRILVFGPDISEGPASRTESPLLDGSPRQ